MNWIYIELLAIAIVGALACALPGLFLVLRGVALMSDAMSHAILLGIVLMFLLVHQLGSPWLLLGAAAAGLATVVCTEALIQTHRIKKDTAIGLVFPFFFSVGVLLITLFARDVHLDTDMVLLGELAFAPFHRFVWVGMDLGPLALWQLGTILLLNSIVLYAIRKELMLATFDPHYAQVIGFSPVLIHYILMTLTSITAVGAFDSVGAIVVVALMITPGATAYLLTRQLKEMVILTALLAICASVGGFWLAIFADVSIAGSIATMGGIIFVIVLIVLMIKQHLFSHIMH